MSSLVISRFCGDDLVAYLQFFKIFSERMYPGSYAFCIGLVNIA